MEIIMEIDYGNWQWKLTMGISTMDINYVNFNYG